jgi:uncharacterized protein YlzI (FlbEa/FlbD family)
MTKLIKLTKQPYGETIMINPQYVTVIEEMADGTNINMMMGGTCLVKESIDKVSKLVSNGGWITTHNASNAQTDAE